MTESVLACVEAQRMLGAYNDGELSPVDDLRVEVHVEECAVCRSERKSLAEVSSLLREQGSSVGESPAWSCVLEGIDGAEVGIETPRPRRFLWSPARIWWSVGAVAASFLLGLLGASLWTQSSPSESVLSPVPLDSLAVLGAGIPELDAYLSSHQAREVPLDELGRHVSFEPRAPRELPGGFRLERSYVVREQGRSNTCLVYRNGSDAVGLLQHERALPSTLSDGTFEERRVGGLSCRIVMRGQMRVVRIDPLGSNLTLVVTQAGTDVDRLVRYLGNGAL